MSAFYPRREAHVYSSDVFGQDQGAGTEPHRHHLRVVPCQLPSRLDVGIGSRNSTFY